MKISKIFHSLYFMVMFLPLFIIPIFAININQKAVEPISIEVPVNEFVDFNQLFDKTDSYQITIASNINSTYADYNFNSTHRYVYRFTIQSLTYSGNNYFGIGFWNSNNTQYRRYFSGIITQDGTYQYYINPTYWEGTSMSSYENLKLVQQNLGTYSSDNFTRISGIQLFDLTQMFGEGNEPTVNEFNTMFPKENLYTFTLSEEELINTGYRTDDNTDIGSQFLYSLYKPVHDYFNFGEYFGLTGVYNWFEMNWFNGTAPLPFFIFYNLMIYWLIISLLWLIFDVLIYVPMVIHRWLDKGALE